MYLSKSPFSPAEGDKCSLNRKYSDLGTLLNNRNITLSCLQNPDILQEASLPCLISFSPPATPNKKHSVSIWLHKL